jgi:hypothetical protein
MVRQTNRGRSWARAALLIGALTAAGCGAGVASAPPVSPSATAAPSRSPVPTPSPSPTVDRAAAAAGYLAIANALHDASCAGNAAMDADPDSLPVLKQSFAATSDAAETARQDLLALALPPAAEPFRDPLVEIFADLRDATFAVSEAGSFEEVDQVFPAVEEASAAVGEAGKAIRTALGLPAGETAC